MLIDEDVIETGDEGDPWRVHLHRVRPDHMPSTLTGVLQSRLDGLPTIDRDALQRASVVGRVFWDDAVRSLQSDVPASTLESLERARQRELLLRHDPSTFEATVEYAFKHALLRDVTYETVLLRERRRLHRLVAGWMTDHAGERASEYSTQIASHLRLAGELAAAAALLHRSATSALDTGNVLAARRYLEEALSLWRECGEVPPVDALVSMAEARVRCDDPLSAPPYLDEALPRASTPAERARAHFVGSWIASDVGFRTREEQMLRAAMPDAERVGGVLLVRVLVGLGWWEINRGETAPARVYAEKAHILARQLHARSHLERRWVCSAGSPTSRAASARRCASAKPRSQSLRTAETSRGRHSPSATSGSPITCSVTPAVRARSTAPRTRTTSRRDDCTSASAGGTTTGSTQPTSRRSTSASERRSHRVDCSTRR
jgi:hypothetical protein